MLLVVPRRNVLVALRIGDGGGDEAFQQLVIGVMLQDEVFLDLMCISLTSGNFYPPGLLITV